MKFDFYVHASMIAGNIEWVEGVTQSSFGISLLIAFLLFLIATMLIISAAFNARKEVQ